jgi:hypothetical protein
VCVFCVLYALYEYVGSDWEYYYSQGDVVDVTLRRVKREEISDHVKMFELFTQVKEMALGRNFQTAAS